MYRITGADGRLYGPVSADRIRQWISEGRVTPQTLIHTETGEWKPLVTFHEFADWITEANSNWKVAEFADPQIPPVAVGSRWKLVAGLLGIFLGGLGIHRFYLGYTNIAMAQILVTLCTCGIGHLWGMTEGACIITGKFITTDAQGVPLRD